MQENTQWYESTHALAHLSLRKQGKEFSKSIQNSTALKFQTLAVRWQCTIELVAVNLVSKLPRPFGAALRRLVYPLFFAHTGNGLHVRASQPFGRMQPPIHTDAGKARSLYENCLRGCLKSDR